MTIVSADSWVGIRGGGCTGSTIGFLPLNGDSFLEIVCVHFRVHLILAIYCHFAFSLCSSKNVLRTFNSNKNSTTQPKQQSLLSYSSIHNRDVTSTANCSVESNIIPGVYQTPADISHQVPNLTSILKDNFLQR